MNEIRFNTPGDAAEFFTWLGNRPYPSISGRFFRDTENRPHAELFVNGTTPLSADETNRIFNEWAFGVTPEPARYPARYIPIVRKSAMWKPVPVCRPSGYITHAEREPYTNPDGSPTAIIIWGN